MTKIIATIAIFVSLVVLLVVDTAYSTVFTDHAEALFASITHHSHKIRK